MTISFDSEADYTLVCLETLPRGGSRFCDLISTSLPNLHYYSAINSTILSASIKSLLDIVDRRSLVITSGIKGVVFSILISPFLILSNQHIYLFLHTPSNRLSRTSRALLKLFAAFHNNHILFVADHLSIGYRDTLPIDKCQTTYAPVLSSYKNPNSISTNCRSDSDSRTDKLRLVFTGGSSPEKNLPFLLDSLKLLSDIELSRVELHIYGTITETTSDDLKDLSLLSFVRLKGFSPNIDWNDPLYNCTIHLMPSSYEGMPLSVLEAAFNGVPSLTSDASAFREIYSRFPSFTLKLIPLHNEMWAASIRSLLRTGKSTLPRIGNADIKKFSYMQFPATWPATY